MMLSFLELHFHEEVKRPIEVQFSLTRGTGDYHDLYDREPTQAYKVIPQLHTVREVYRRPYSWFCSWGQMKRKFWHCHKFSMSNSRFDSRYDPCLLMNRYKCSMKGRTHLLTRRWTQTERVSILLLLLLLHSHPQMPWKQSAVLVCGHNFTYLLLATQMDAVSMTWFIAGNFTMCIFM